MIKGKQYCSETYETKIVDGKKIKVTTGEKIESNVTNNSNDFYMNKGKALILNQSSERLNQIRDNSIDLYNVSLAYSLDSFIQNSKNGIRPDLKNYFYRDERLFNEAIGKLLNNMQMILI